MSDEKVQENRVRRAAERQGFRVTKSRRRDPRARDYGHYWLVDENVYVDGPPGEPLEFGSLDVLETYLNSDDHERAEIEELNA